MGKKNITIRDSDFYSPDKDLRAALDYFDVKGAGGGGKPSARNSSSSSQYRSADDVKADLKAAKDSHYAFNRGLEAAAMSGDKKSKSLMNSGMGNVGGIMRGVKHLSKLKKDSFGGGGMNGGENQSVLAYDLVQQDREKQEENLVSKDFLDERLNALKDKFKTEAPETEGPVEYDESPEVVSARERLDSDYYDTSESIYNVGTEEPVTAFRQANENAPVRDDTSTAVGSYLDQYKKDLIKGGHIGEARTDNLNNAYNTVIGNDI